jgi:hypothetical protein
VFKIILGRIQCSYCTNIYKFYLIDDWLTVRRSITLVDLQLDAQTSCLFTYNTLTLILLMWRIGWAPNNIPIYISNKMQPYTIYLYLKTALHISGGTSTHHQERVQLYLQHLVFVTPLLLSAAIVKELVRHPQHTQTGSNSSTIAADSSNGVTNTRCCRYSCMCSW